MGDKKEELFEAFFNQFIDPEDDEKSKAIVEREFNNCYAVLSAEAEKIENGEVFNDEVVLEKLQEMQVIEHFRKEYANG